MIQHCISSGSVHSCKLTPSAPVIPHLLFADDGLFYFKANIDEANELKNCFAMYEAPSGQQIISRSRQSFLAPMLKHNIKVQLYNAWGFMRFQIMALTWAYLHLLGGLRSRSLILFWSRHIREFKVGRDVIYL